MLCRLLPFICITCVGMRILTRSCCTCERIIYSGVMVGTCESHMTVMFIRVIAARVCERHNVREHDTLLRGAVGLPHCLMVPKYAFIWKYGVRWKY